MYKLLIVCNGKRSIIVEDNLDEVHKDCTIIEKLAHKQHCYVTVKCYDGDTRLFDRFFSDN
jgi:hypothetical protein